MPPPGWARAEASVTSPPLPTLERLRAASFSLNNVKGYQGLIVDPGSTVSVELTTEHTVKVYKLHFVRLIKMGTADTRAERIGIRLYFFPVEQEQTGGLRCSAAGPDCSHVHGLHHQRPKPQGIRIATRLSTKV